MLGYLTGLTSILGVFLLPAPVKDIVKKLMTNEIIQNIISYGLDIYVYIRIKVEPYFQDYKNKTQEKRKDRYELIKDGKLILDTSYSEHSLIKNKKTNDMLVYKKVNDNNTYDCIICNSIEEANNYTPSNIKFIAVSVIITKKGCPEDIEKLSIKINIDNENYYIVNNIINPGLIWLLLYKQHNINKDDYEVNFTMNIIDNKAKIILLNNKQSIQILETEYSIIGG